MKGRRRWCAAALVLAASWAAPVAAADNKLACMLLQNTKKTTIMRVTNNGTAPIPAGSGVAWRVRADEGGAPLTGDFRLSAALAPGGSILHEDSAFRSMNPDVMMCEITAVKPPLGSGRSGIVATDTPRVSRPDIKPPAGLCKPGWHARQPTRQDAVDASFQNVTWICERNRPAKPCADGYTVEWEQNGCGYRCVPVRPTFTIDNCDGTPFLLPCKYGCGFAGG